MHNKEGLLDELRSCHNRAKQSLQINITVSARLQQPVGLGPAGPGLGTELYLLEKGSALRACRDAGISEEEISTALSEE